MFLINVTEKKNKNNFAININRYNINSIINVIQLTQAGTYWCELGNTVGSIYYLHIDSDSEIMTVHPDSTALVESVPEYKLKVYTTWTAWSPCSTCNAIGIKLRYGYCTVSLLEMTEHRYLVNENVSTMNELRYMKRGVKKGK